VQPRDTTLSSASVVERALGLPSPDERNVECHGRRGSDRTIAHRERRRLAAIEARWDWPAATWRVARSSEVACSLHEQAIEMAASHGATSTIRKRDMTMSDKTKNEMTGTQVKKTKSRLFSRETLRRLDEAVLERVQGGGSRVPVPPTQMPCYPSLP
jgi:hypothetical protein